MEGTGAIQTLTDIAKTNRAFVGCVTTDDDSSMRRNMRHSFQAKVDCGKMEMKDWPKTAKGNKKSDSGLLPLSVPEPEFLADFNHRTRTFASELFALARLPKYKSEMTPVDAERLKRNFTYCMRGADLGDFQGFVDSMPAVLEHQFNCHDWCGDWCPVRRILAEKKTVDHLKYRDKEADAKLYKQLKEFFCRYTTEDKLQEIFHDDHTNCCESFIFFVTKVLPKHKVLCRTIANNARVHVAVSVSSIGYEKSLTRLYAKFGKQLGLHQTKHLRYLDERRAYYKKKWATPEWHRRRANGWQKK